jgi:hypothetical protein
MKAIEDAEVREQKIALSALQQEMASQSATTLGEKLILAKEKKAREKNEK